MIEIADSACYVPVRDEAWRGQRLRPASPDWLEDDDAFGKASDVLASSGIATDAWIVLCHDDTLGRLHPDLVTRNAFGDRYPYALCPSSPDVREYAETLAEEVVLAHRVRGVVLEACGPVGVEHASLHDNVEFASWTPTDLDLLSLCFCDACRLAMSTIGLDADELAARVRAAVGGAALSVEEALGADVASTLATFRRGLVTTLLRGCVERVTRLARWADRARDGRSLGLAVHHSFLTYVAVVASVVKDAGGKVHVDEAWVVGDAGTVVNPDRGKAMMEGAVIFGMSLALHGSITMKKGAVEQTNFRDYRLVRLPEAPRAIHVELVESDAPPGGAGAISVAPGPARTRFTFRLVSGSIMTRAYNLRAVTCSMPNLSGSCW